MRRVKVHFCYGKNIIIIAMTKGIKKYKMVKKEGKIWVYNTKLGTIISDPTILIMIAMVIFTAKLIKVSPSGDATAEGFFLALKFCGKCLAIVVPIFFIIWSIRLFRLSAYIVFTDNTIKRYKHIFAKEYKEIHYTDITECVISHGLWKYKEGYKGKREIFLFNKGKCIAKYDINYRIMFMLYKHLESDKIRVIGDNGHKKTIDKFYKIDFMNLSDEQQIILCKDYCHDLKSDEIEGEKILKKKLRKRK